MKKIEDLKNKINKIKYSVGARKNIYTLLALVTSSAALIQLISTLTMPIVFFSLYGVVGAACIIDNRTIMKKQEKEKLNLEKELAALENEEKSAGKYNENDNKQESIKELEKNCKQATVKANSDENQEGFEM